MLDPPGTPPPYQLRPARRHALSATRFSIGCGRVIEGNAQRCVPRCRADTLPMRRPSTAATIHPGQRPLRADPSRNEPAEAGQVGDQLRAAGKPTLRPGRIEPRPSFLRPSSPPPSVSYVGKPSADLRRDPRGKTAARVSCPLSCTQPRPLTTRRAACICGQSASIEGEPSRSPCAIAWSASAAPAPCSDQARFARA